MNRRFSALPVSGRTALTVVVACLLSLAWQRNVPAWYVPVQVFADWFLAALLVAMGGELARRALHAAYGTPKVVFTRRDVELRRTRFLLMLLDDRDREP
jgi:hypothetical protein